MTTEQVQKLLQAEESDRLERKASLSDTDAIRDTFIQFANDLAGRGGGHLIVGQAPDKSITRLIVGDDEAQQRLADIARNRCRPAIPITVECHLISTARIAIVDIRASAARPHFTGNCYVRVGSTKRAATDAEIVALRYAGANPKIAELQGWLADGKTTITTLQLAKDPMRGSAFTGVMKLLEVRANYIVLQSGSERPVTLPISEFDTAWDYSNNRLTDHLHDATSSLIQSRRISYHLIQSSGPPGPKYVLLPCGFRARTFLDSSVAGQATTKNPRAIIIGCRHWSDDFFRETLRA
jgi:Putative DNA-binding domain